MTVPRILVLCGSQRRESLNARLLQHLAAQMDGRCEFDMLGAAGADLPLFNQDLETDPVVVSKVLAVHQRFADCDALLVASPEYNGQLTPYLKNTVDWVSRLARIGDDLINPFLHRPLLLCSATTGASGGTVGIAHARALFGYLGCLVLGETVCVPLADQAWTPDGFAFDPFFDDHIDSCMSHLLSLAAAHRLSHNHVQLS